MDDSLDKVIIEILETKQPKNVKELVQLIQEKFSISSDAIKQELATLHQKGQIVLEEPPLKSFFRNGWSSRGVSLVVTISLVFFAFISITFFPESETPLSYLRYVFGFILAAFLPGYCLTESLFPEKNALDEIERFTFSIGLSFAVTALVGLFLSFTPFGLTLVTAFVALCIIVIILALVAFERKKTVE